MFLEYCHYCFDICIWTDCIWTIVLILIYELTVFYHILLILTLEQYISEELEAYHQDSLLWRQQLTPLVCLVVCKVLSLYNTLHLSIKSNKYLIHVNHNNLFNAIRGLFHRSVKIINSEINVKFLFILKKRLIKYCKD